MKKQLLTLAAVTASLILAASPATEEAAKIVTEKKLSNLCKNGDFKWVSKDRKGAGYWSFWKRKDSQGTVTYEEKSGINDSTGAVFTGGSGSLYTRIAVKPGDRIYLRAKVKKTGEGKAGLTVKYQTAKNGDWVSAPSVSKTVKFSKDGDWADVELIVKVPQKAERIVPMLSASDLNTPESRIVFDNVEVYKLPAFEPAK